MVNNSNRRHGNITNCCFLLPRPLPSPPRLFRSLSCHKHVRLTFFFKLVKEKHDIKSKQSHCAKKMLHLLLLNYNTIRLTAHIRGEDLPFFSVTSSYFLLCTVCTLPSNPNHLIIIIKDLPSGYSNVTDRVFLSFFSEPFPHYM